MDFHKNLWECYSYKPKYPCQFLVKSIENFYFYSFLFLILNFLLSHTHFSKENGQNYANIISEE